MDIRLKKRPWYVRYRWYVAGGAAFAAFAAYVAVQGMGPRRLRVDTAGLQVAEVRKDRFLEYVETEGVLQPILTLKVNTAEEGTVERMVAEEGTMLHKGDTILVMENAALRREIDEQRDALEKQLIAYREQEIEMEQKTLSLRKQALQNEYELESMAERHELDAKEYEMGYSSKAQYKVSDNEYQYRLKAARLEREILTQDSAANQIRRQLLGADRERETRKFARMNERLERLVVTAPIDGQLSFVNVTPGQRVGAGESIGEIKVLSQYRIHTALSEFYIDRIVSGLPASITYKDRTFPLRITKVVPEVKADRTFGVDLLFAAEVPDNARVGKNYRVQIELGQAEEVVTIPRGDFYSTTGGRWIYRLTPGGGRAERVPITIGRQNPMQYEVTEGLQPGDRVITTGYSRFGDAEELELDIND